MTSDRWRRIEALYHQVLAHPLHERAEALAAACAGDSALQAEVQSLLDQPERVGVLGTPVVNVAVQGVPAKATLTGQRVGVFEVRGLLGAGGMGEVYRAWDPRLAREVALKVLPGDVADNPARRRRFLEEARAIGSLNHPNIVAVFDVGVGEGIPFIGTATFGSFDVFVSRRNSTKKEWSAPVNLGPNVNTAGSETRSTLSWDGRRLYFGRDGDIYSSTRTRQQAY